MIKRIIHFQNLLYSLFESVTTNIKNQPYFGIKMFSIFLCLMFFSRYIFKNIELSLMYFLIILSITYMILHGKFKIYELLPISNRFFVSNIFLFVITLAIFAHIVTVILGFVFVNLLILIVLVFSLGKYNGYVGFTSDQIPIPVSGDTKNFLLILLIYIILLFGCTALFFIKRKKIRIASIIGFVAAVFGFVIWLKHNMPIPLDPININTSVTFYLMPQANNILFYLGISAAIIVPLSIYIANKLYRPKSKSKAH